jgi:aspartate racemase
MVEASVDACRDRLPGVSRIGVLCTRGTRRTRLYERAADRVGIGVVQVDERLQRTRVDEAITLVKGGADRELAGEHLDAAAEALRTAGAEVVVAACTEIGLVRTGVIAGIPLVDSTDCLAARVHRRVTELRLERASLTTA